MSVVDTSLVERVVLRDQLEGSALFAQACIDAGVSCAKAKKLLAAVLVDWTDEDRVAVTAILKRWKQ